MSWPALAWASKQRTGRASDKLVLIALADRHNEDSDRAFPSINWLCEFCDLNRKTVIAALDRLETREFISDTGERCGKTNQIKSYSLAIGTVPKAEPSQKRNSSTSSVKQSQKRDTEPSLEPSPPVSSNDDTIPAAPILELVADNDPPAKLQPAHVAEAWNAMCERTGLPKCRTIEGQRERKLRLLIRKFSIEDFTEAIANVERAPWMHGDNQRGWRCDFKFFLTNFVSILEGSYVKSAA